jgi:hypothetical protein
MDTTAAMTSSSAMRMPASPMTKATRRALRGSFVAPTPLARGRGTMASRPRAWRMRGAPRIDPRALDSVAPQTPPITAGDHTAMFSKKRWSPTRSSAGKPRLRKTARPA